MGTTLSMDSIVGALKELYGGASWYDVRGAKKELLARINALSDFEKTMLNIDEA